MDNPSYKIILVIISAIIGFITNGCGYNIVRNDYELSKNKEAGKVHIYKFLDSTQGLVKKGSINLEQGDWTYFCDEKDAIKLLKEEACKINANVVNITKENQSNKEPNCYTCEADFYYDSTDAIIKTHWPYRTKTYKNPFDSLPFNYAYFHLISIDYHFANEKYWKDLLSKYNLPAENVLPFIPGIGFTYFDDDFYYDGTISYAEGGADNIDSLKSNLYSFKLAVNFGYNLINKTFTISPFIGLRYFHETHVVSLNYGSISYDNFMSKPDITLHTQEFSSVFGINIVYPISKWLIFGINFGYNLNFSNSALLFSDQNKIEYNGKSIMGRYFIDLNWGFGAPENSTYDKQYDFDDE